MMKREPADKFELVSDFGFARSRHVAPPATPLGDKARERGTGTNWAARNQTLANGYNSQYRKFRSTGDVQKKSTDAVAHNPRPALHRKRADQVLLLTTHNIGQ
jgi:hypothetical protein